MLRALTVPSSREVTQFDITCHGSDGSRQRGRVLTVRGVTSVSSVTHLVRPGQMAGDGDRLYRDNQGSPHQCHHVMSSQQGFVLRPGLDQITLIT